MRKILALLASLCLVASSAAAQAPSQSAASKSDLLSMDQKIKIAQLITKQTPPLTSSGFSIAVDRIVPADIELHSLPADAQRLAPQLRGFGYIVSSRSKSPSWTSARERSKSYFRAGANSEARRRFWNVMDTLRRCREDLCERVAFANVRIKML
jgi:hypothetical protein